MSQKAIALLTVLMLLAGCLCTGFRMGSGIRPAPLTHPSAQEEDADGGDSGLSDRIGTKTPAEPKDAEEAASEKGTAYTFLDGRMTMYFPEEEFNVLTQDNSGSPLSLERLGIERERADLYMQLVGYALKAVAADETLQDNAWEITVNIKDPDYPGLNNLKDMPAAEKDLLASALILGFGVNGYEWHITEQAEYIVFDWGNETRYATVIGEQMIYIFIGVPEGTPGPEEKALLQSVVDEIDWEL